MSELIVVEGAQMECDKGVMSTRLVVTTNPFVQVNGRLVASIHDRRLGANIKSPYFNLCKITGKPCRPSIPQPWTPGGSSVLVPTLLPVLPESATLKCTVGGKISVTDPGQVLVTVDPPFCDSSEDKEHFDLLFYEPVQATINTPQTGADNVPSKCDESDDVDAPDPEPPEGGTPVLPLPQPEPVPSRPTVRLPIIRPPIPVPIP